MSYIKLTPRQRRKKHIRKTISGTTARPRFVVFKSNRYLYAQLIDDTAHKTLVAASSLKDGGGATAAVGTKIGKAIAEKALGQKIESVVFDRNGYRFHGVVKAMADSAREAGLKF
jgi:large subunit ribosomal protein L18